MERRFQKQSRGRVSWWSIDQTGVRYRVSWGSQVGGAQSRTVTRASEAEAAAEVERKIREKLRAGYLELAENAHQGPAAATAAEPGAAREATPAAAPPAAPTGEPPPAVTAAEPLQPVLEAFEAHAKKFSFSVERVAGTSRSYHVFGGLGFEEYLVLGPDPVRGLRFAVKASDHDPRNVAVFLAFLEANHERVFGVPTLWKAELPAPIGAMTHAIVLSPEVAQSYHSGLRRDQLFAGFPIHCSEFLGDESIAVAAARVSGRNSIPQSRWSRDPHPVVDFALQGSKKSRKPPAFKVYCIGDIRNVLRRAKGAIELRGILGVARIAVETQGFDIARPNQPELSKLSLQEATRELEAFVLATSALGTTAARKHGIEPGEPTPQQPEPKPKATSEPATATRSSANAVPNESSQQRPLPPTMTVDLSQPPEMSLRNAVLAEPERLDVRQVYADFLQQKADPFGEYVSLATLLLDESTPDYLQRAERAQALYREHGPSWLAAWGGNGVDIKLYAGFPDRISIGTRPLPAELARTLAECPVRTLAFRDTPLPTIKKVLKLHGRERVRSLYVQPKVPGGAGLRDALGKADWPSLVALHLGHTFQARDAEVVALTQHMPLLRELGISTYSSPPRAWDKARQLERLVIERNTFPPFHAFLEQLDSLRSITCGGLSMPDGAAPLPSVQELWVVSDNARQLACFPNLHTLSLGGELDDSTLRDLASFPLWGSLRTLHLTISPAAVERFAHYLLPLCGALEVLGIVPTPGVPELVSALPRLRALEVQPVSGKRTWSQLTIDDDFARELVGRLPASITRVGLTGEFGLDGVKALATHPGLTEVMLSSDAFDRACLEVLLGVPTLRRIDYRRSASGFSAEASSLPSGGRYLGPPRGESGRAVWSHEP